MGGGLRARGVAAAALSISLCFAGLVAGSAPALARSVGRKTVRYHGVALRVPRSWPVYHLVHAPQVCVRFDRHAVYLGDPGAIERCPAHSVGRTEAILVAPTGASSRAVRLPTASELQLHGHARSFFVPSARVEVTVTWSRAPTVVASALGRRSLPHSSTTPPHAAGRAPRTSDAVQRRARALATLPAGQAAQGTVYTGRGFDTCSAPSASQMSAWYRSPYRAVGIYLGGINMGCAQPNLNSRWVAHEIAAGWHMVPIYVGLQAPRNSCGCSPISTSTAQAAAQGRAAAGDAISQAQRLGIGAGNPIYDDMEGYATGGSNTAAVLAFLSGWSAKLRSSGYLSGVYSSASSGIADLVRRYGTTYQEPNDIWIADWNGAQTTSDPYVPSGEWRNHQRLHQYAGGRTETYGGVTLNVDDDYLDGSTAYKVVSYTDGYVVGTSDGGVHPFGKAVWYGSDRGKLAIGLSATSLALDHATGGYWILKSNGGVDNFHAPWNGSLKGKLGGMRPVAIAGTPSGGYLVLTNNGGVYAFGAPSYGSDAGRLPRGTTAVALAVDPATGGYWILKSNGGVDNFKAPWDGSLRGKLGGQRAEALAVARQGGYLILTSDGALHPFGAATLYGSDQGKLRTGVKAVSLATSPTAPGYRILRSDGGVDSFKATTYGSLRGSLAAGERPTVIAEDR